MPHLTGLDLIAHLRTRPDLAVPVILLSAAVPAPPPPPTAFTSGPQLDISVTLDPLNIAVDDAPRTGVTICTTTGGSADCYKVI
jgi:CheY-like chemotaxis protein